MHFFKKSTLQEKIFLSIFLLLVTYSFFSGMSFTIRGQPVYLSIDPFRYYTYLFIHLSIIVGYILWVLLREDD